MFSGRKYPGKDFKRIVDEFGPTPVYLMGGYGCHNVDTAERAMIGPAIFECKWSRDLSGPRFEPYLQCLFHFKWADVDKILNKYKFDVFGEQDLDSVKTEPDDELASRVVSASGDSTSGGGQAIDTLAQAASIVAPAPPIVASPAMQSTLADVAPPAPKRQRELAALLDDGHIEFNAGSIVSRKMTKEQAVVAMGMNSIIFSWPENGPQVRTRSNASGKMAANLIYNANKNNNGREQMLKMKEMEVEESDSDEVEATVVEVEATVVNSNEEVPAAVVVPVVVEKVDGFEIQSSAAPISSSSAGPSSSKAKASSSKAKAKASSSKAKSFKRGFDFNSSDDSDSE